MIRIIIGGDICPLGKVEKLFSEGAADKIFNDLLEEINTADLSIVNLECPLISRQTPITKLGPVLGAKTECIEGFKAAKWQVLNVANNHSFDHGTVGFDETLNTIKNAGLNVVGAGINIEQAQIPFVTQINNQRIVIFAMAEREFSIADENTPGANPLDLINFVYAIKKYKNDGVFIVLIHGGNEYYPYPSPEFLRRCRFMVDMGADAVICSHTHCPLPWEIYAGKPIIYGLGNLIFEAIGESTADWYEGYLAQITIDKTQINFEPIPYNQSLNTIGCRKMSSNDQKLFLESVTQKGRELKDRTLLNNHWQEYSLQKKVPYLSELFGYNKIMHKISKLLNKPLHSRIKILRSLHIVQCEAHQEILKTILMNEMHKG